MIICKSDVNRMGWQTANKNRHFYSQSLKLHFNTNRVHLAPGFSVCISFRRVLTVDLSQWRPHTKAMVWYRNLYAINKLRANVPLHIIWYKVQSNAISVHKWHAFTAHESCLAFFMHFIFNRSGHYKWPFQIRIWLKFQLISIFNANNDNKFRWVS